MGLLKFRDKDGKLRFIQFDHDSRPREVSEIAIEVLREYGLEEEIDEEEPDESTTDCPEGYDFGVDTNKYDECEECAIWKDCMKEKKNRK